MFLAVLLVTASLVFEGALSQRRGRISFIEPRECLKFDVLCNATDYQVRRYNELAWIGTRLTKNWHGMFKWWSGIRRLFQYTQAANSAGVEFNSTAQFLASIAEDGMVNVYLLLPAEYQANPPTPSDLRVFTTRLSQMDAYVRTFEGNRRMFRKESKALNVSLTRDNVMYNDSIYYVAFCKRNARTRTGPGFGNRGKRSAGEEGETDLTQDGIFDDWNDASGDGTDGDAFPGDELEIMPLQLENIRNNRKRQNARTRTGPRFENRGRRSAGEEGETDLTQDDIFDDWNDASGDGTDGDAFPGDEPEIMPLQLENIRNNRKKQAEIWFIATGSPNCPTM